MRGELEVNDIPAEWNRLYREQLGVEVPCDSSGCLQDMHWPSGLIGYFPTYAIGNAYAAQILYAMKKELDIEALVAAGDIPEITAWLRERIHRYGRIKTAEQIVCDCCGEGLDPKCYTDYLSDKYSKLYGV